jgi:hypothetical protein
MKCRTENDEMENKKIQRMTATVTCFFEKKIKINKLLKYPRGGGHNVTRLEIKVI